MLLLLHSLRGLLHSFLRFGLKALVPALILLQIFGKFLFFKLSALLKQSSDGEVLRRAAGLCVCEPEPSPNLRLHPNQILNMVCLLMRLKICWIRRESSIVFDARVRVS